AVGRFLLKCTTNKVKHSKGVFCCHHRTGISSASAADKSFTDWAGNLRANLPLSLGAKTKGDMSRYRAVRERDDEMDCARAKEKQQRSALDGFEYGSGTGLIDCPIYSFGGTK
ncbi:unnamed protein product, partial [Ascophyllum nodosum]